MAGGVRGGGLKKFDSSPPVLFRAESLVDCVLAIMGEAVGSFKVLVRLKEGRLAM